MEIKLNATDFAGRKTVIYEELRKNDKVIASHREITSKDQSIVFPEVMTTAYEKESGEGLIMPGDEVTIVDEVRYSNISKGMKYTVKGKLINKNNGRSVSENEISFTSDSTEGSTLLEFEINPRPDTDYVVFEEMYVEDEKGKLKLIASHKDMDSEEQTVTVGTAAKTGDETGILAWIIIFACACSMTYVYLRKGKE